MRFISRGAFLTLVAMFAMSAVTASAASAAAPEFKPVPTKKKFTSTSGSVTWAYATEVIVCSKSTIAGEIVSASTLGKAVMTYTGCKRETPSGTCSLKSIGAKEGEIVTGLVKGELGTVSTKEAASGVGLLLKPETGSGFATLAESPPCELGETVLEGSMAPEVATVGKKQTTNKLVFGVKSGKQDIKEITVGSKLIKPKLSAWGVAAITTEATDELTFEEALEVT
jgi:hypothetical protein